MKNYFKVMLGAKSNHAQTCLEEGFIGADYGINLDLTYKLSDSWKTFNNEFIPIFLKNRPDKSKIAAGLSCGALWTISKGILIGDIVICPDGNNNYLVGEVKSDYSYHPEKILQHRRNVKWFPNRLNRADMSTDFQKSTVRGTATLITKYSSEIENLIGGISRAVTVENNELVEDLAAFALEKHLEDFLVENWEQTELGKKYNIVRDEKDIIGQQFPTDTGPIDILAESKDKKELLVIELKRGRASDAVVGQIQRYMSYIIEVIATQEQIVKGVIIALDDDKKIKRALSVAKNIDFYTYQINFKLLKR